MKSFRVSGGEPEAKRGSQGYPFDNSEFQISYMPIQSGIYKIYLFGEIESPEQFIPAIEVLNRATENDLVLVYLQTPGGSLDATDTFIHEMRECDARIIVKASGGVHSAGSVILMNADEFILSENFNCLIHNGSCGAVGKTSDFRAQARATDAYMDKVMRSTYEGFLTEEEVEQLIEGKDFWFDAEGFMERWNSRNEYLEAKSAEDADEDAEAALQAALEAVTQPRKRRQKVEQSAE